MISSYPELYRHVRRLPPKRIAVAGAGADVILDALEDVREAAGLGGVLVGDAEKIRTRVDAGNWQIEDQKDPAKAALRAAALVRNGSADILMKGACATADFLRACLDDTCGLRTGSLMSHVLVISIANAESFKLMSDGAIIVRPTVEEKAHMVENAVRMAHALGIERPAAAVISGTEKPTPNLPDSIDAEKVAAQTERWDALGCDVAGPLAIDCAASARAASAKGIAGPVAGRADIYILPDVVAGNVFGKCVSYFGGADTGGLVLGAQAPIVMLSRSSTTKEITNSIYLGLFAAEKMFGEAEGYRE
jgi:phosphate butyryltransferase